MHPITIILVAPQMGENIGAAARVMKNFGIYDLRIVNPRDDWPNPKARAVAAGADDILDNAKIFFSLSNAIADIKYLLAACALTRNIYKNYFSLEKINIASIMQTNVAIMFGRENCGLQNDEIAYANAILTIPTQISFSSLNLAQAVGLVCYEFTKFKMQKNKRENIQDLANKSEINYLLNHLFKELDSKEFFKVKDKRIQMIENITNIFTRNDLSKKETQILRGIIKSLTKNSL